MLPLQIEKKTASIFCLNFPLTKPIDHPFCLRKECVLSLITPILRLVSFFFLPLTCLCCWSVLKAIPPRATESAKLKLFYAWVPPVPIFTSSCQFSHIAVMRRWNAMEISPASLGGDLYLTLPRHLSGSIRKSIINAVFRNINVQFPALSLAKKPALYLLVCRFMEHILKWCILFVVLIIYCY